jgi:hypothetical protein
MALSPLSRRRPDDHLLAGSRYGCGEDIDHPLALWQPWAFPGEWALSSVGIVEPGLDFNIMTQRGRASATVQSWRRNALPPRGRLCSSGEWDLAGALRGRQLSAGGESPRSCSSATPPAAGGDRA